MISVTQVGLHRSRWISLWDFVIIIWHTRGAALQIMLYRALRRTRWAHVPMRDCYLFYWYPKVGTVSVLFSVLFGHTKDLECIELWSTKPILQCNKAWILQPFDRKTSRVVTCVKTRLLLWFTVLPELDILGLLIPVVRESLQFSRCQETNMASAVNRFSF